MVTSTIIGLFLTLGVFQKNAEIKADFQEIKARTDSMALTIDSMRIELNNLEETHPYQKKRWKSKRTGLCTEGNFFGFLLYTPVDTTIAPEFALVLSEWKGPTAKVNSVRRNHNHKSRHYHGKAIDLAWDDDVIAFLLSEEGRSWLNKHGVTFYIEGQPGSRKVRKYVNDPVASEYVFFNPNASGDHIHLNI